LPLCFFKVRYKLNSNIANHMAQSSTTRFMTLFTPSMSNLVCKPWFARKMFIGLMNALCCCSQTLPWPKVLTNYFDDNWLCIVNIILKFDWLVLFDHMSGGGKLMTTSLWNLKVQKVTSKT
jgi:hypothetical protein